MMQETNHMLDSGVISNDDAFELLRHTFRLPYRCLVSADGDTMTIQAGYKAMEGLGSAAKALCLPVVIRMERSGFAGDRISYHIIITYKP